jgi:hypothetical protein
VRASNGIAAAVLAVGALALAVGVLALGGCASSRSDLGSPAVAWAPAPGATHADSAEQVRVVKAIRAMDDLRVDRCKERRVSDTAILNSSAAAPDSAGTAGGADSTAAWSYLPRHERWTIDRCGKQVSYLVEFSPEDSGRVAITVRFQ